MVTCVSMTNESAPAGHEPNGLPSMSNENLNTPAGTVKLPASTTEKLRSCDAIDIEMRIVAAPLVAVSVSVSSVGVLLHVTVGAASGSVLIGV